MQHGHSQSAPPRPTDTSGWRHGRELDRARRLARALEKWARGEPLRTRDGQSVAADRVGELARLIATGAVA